jgi:hypothetical protein
LGEFARLLQVGPQAVDDLAADVKQAVPGSIAIAACRR